MNIADKLQNRLGRFFNSASAKFAGPLAQGVSEPSYALVFKCLSLTFRRPQKPRPGENASSILPRSFLDPGSKWFAISQIIKNLLRKLPILVMEAPPVFINFFALNRYPALCRGFSGSLFGALLVVMFWKLLTFGLLFHPCF